MQPQLAYVQTAGVLPPQQVDDDENGGHPLGDGAGDGHALGGHIAADDEHQIQHHVQHTGNEQVHQRPLCVAGGAEDAVAAVVQPHTGQTDGVQLQIQHRAGQKFLLGVQQPQHRLGEEHAHKAYQHAQTQTDQEGRVDGLFHVVVVLHAQSAGSGYVHACARADQQSRKQGHQRGGGAHRAQRDIGVIRVLTGDGHVAEVEQHLQHLRHHQRQAEKQNIFPK